MSAQPTHDLAVKVGEYTDRQSGERKARWQRVGTVFRHDDGGTSIKLDCLPIAAEWSGWVSVFKREPREENAPHRQSQRRGHAGADFQQPPVEFDEIPF